MTDGKDDWKRNLFGSNIRACFHVSVDQRVTSHNQSGGITAHTVNIGRQQFEMTEEAMAQIGDWIKPMEVEAIFAVGGAHASTLAATKLINYLNARGHNFELNDGEAPFCTVISPGLRKPVEFREKQGWLCIDVNA